MIPFLWESVRREVDHEDDGVSRRTVWGERMAGPSSERALNASDLA
jgi:hypothetical protein